MAVLRHGPLSHGVTSSSHSPGKTIGELWALTRACFQWTALTIGNYRAFVAFWLWGKTIGRLRAITRATFSRGRLGPSRKKNKDKSDFFANESSPVLSKSGQNGSPPTIGNYRAFVAFWLWGQTIGELAAISQATLQW